MKLTAEHKRAMALVENGADVFSQTTAQFLRDVEENFGWMIEIGPATADIPGDQQQPYFGAVLTFAGCEAIREAA